MNNTIPPPLTNPINPDGIETESEPDTEDRIAIEKYKIKFKKFKNWLFDNGIIFNKVDINISAVDNKEVIVIEDIKKNEIVI